LVPELRFGERERDEEDDRERERERGMFDRCTYTTTSAGSAGRAL